MSMEINDDFIMSIDPYYKSNDGYDAYQNRELLNREYKDGKVYSTYKCSNMGGEVDIFTTVHDPIVKKVVDHTNDIKDTFVGTTILILLFIIFGLLIINIYLVMLVQ